MTYKNTILVGFTLFGSIFLVGLVTFYISIGKCPSSSLVCDNGKKCIPQKHVCDLIEHCSDRQDENMEMCSTDFGSLNVENTSISVGQANYNTWDKKYNLTENYWTHCALDKQKIAKGCKCGSVNVVICKSLDLKNIPIFPDNVRQIILSNNQITLKEGHDFSSYQKLTTLKLSHNNLSSVPGKFFKGNHGLRKLYLDNNNLTNLPEDTFVNDNSSMIWLILNNNLLSDQVLDVFKNQKELNNIELSNNLLTMKNIQFPRLANLKDLFMDYNQIESLDKHTFSELKNLTLLSLRFNKIEVIEKVAFRELSELKELRLSNNPINQIDDNFNENLPLLKTLYLDYLKIEIRQPLLSTLNVKFISLRGISKQNIDFNAISAIPELETIFFDEYLYCAMIPNSRIRLCRPKSDGLSSNSDLLARPLLRYSSWVMSLFTIAGNLLVFWRRTTFRDENRSVSLVIRNLALSDCLMGIYLGTIGLKDFISRDNYLQVSGEWVSGWTCTFMGALAVVSAEVSLLILAFMSIERFLLISDPFGHNRLHIKNVVMSLYIIWLFGIFIAIYPIIIFPSTKFYGHHNGGTCFPFFVYEIRETGWQYSAFIFIIVNSVLILVIIVLYMSLLFSIWRTRRATTLNFSDCEFAIRFFFIILTDSICWMPIIVIKFLALYTSIDLSSDLYAWIIVFILPMNSAVNPILYTFTTPKYRDQIVNLLTKKSLSIRKHESSSQQVTGEESQTKIIPFLRSSLK